MKHILTILAISVQGLASRAGAMKYLTVRFQWGHPSMPTNEILICVSKIRDVGTYTSIGAYD